MRIVIVGSQHRPGAIAALAELRQGAPIELRREPDNPVDPHAVACFHNDQHLGYVPKHTNRQIGAALEAGEVTGAVLASEAVIEDGVVTTLPRVEVSL